MTNTPTNTYLFVPYQHLSETDYTLVVGGVSHFYGFSYQTKLIVRHSIRSVGHPKTFLVCKTVITFVVILYQFFCQHQSHSMFLRFLAVRLRFKETSYCSLFQWKRTKYIIILHVILVMSAVLAHTTEVLMEIFVFREKLDQVKPDFVKLSLISLHRVSYWLFCPTDFNCYHPLFLLLG